MLDINKSSTAVLIACSCFCFYFMCVLFCLPLFCLVSFPDFVLILILLCYSFSLFLALLCFVFQPVMKNHPLSFSRQTLL